MICAVLSRLNRCNSFSHYRVALRTRKERSQKIDDLPILATCSDVA